MVWIKSKPHLFMNVPKLAKEPSVNTLVYLMLQDKQAKQTNNLMALINLMRLV